MRVIGSKINGTQSSKRFSRPFHWFYLLCMHENSPHAKTAIKIISKLSHMHNAVCAKNKKNFPPRSQFFMTFFLASVHHLSFATATHRIVLTSPAFRGFLPFGNLLCQKGKISLNGFHQTEMSLIFILGIFDSILVWCCLFLDIWMVRWCVLYGNKNLLWCDSRLDLPTLASLINETFHCCETPSQKNAAGILFFRIKSRNVQKATETKLLREK